MNLSNCIFCFKKWKPLRVELVSLPIMKHFIVFFLNITSAYYSFWYVNKRTQNSRIIEATPQQRLQFLCIFFNIFLNLKQKYNLYQIKSFRLNLYKSFLNQTIEIPKLFNKNILFNVLTVCSFIMSKSTMKDASWTH